MYTDRDGNAISLGKRARDDDADDDDNADEAMSPASKKQAATGKGKALHALNKILK